MAINHVMNGRFLSLQLANAIIPIPWITRPCQYMDIYAGFPQSSNHGMRSRGVTANVKRQRTRRHIQETWGIRHIGWPTAMRRTAQQPVHRSRSHIPVERENKLKIQFGLSKKSALAGRHSRPHVRFLNIYRFRELDLPARDEVEQVGRGDDVVIAR